MKFKKQTAFFMLILIMIFTGGCASLKEASVPMATDAAMPQTEEESNQTAETEAYEPQESVVPSAELSDASENISVGAGRSAAPSTSGALSVKGSRLVDKNGEPVQLRGVSTHGIAWFPDYINQKCFSELRNSWNANVVRLAMYTAEYGGYCNGGDRESLKKLIDNGVAYATDSDMYVIIDWHILSDSNPNSNKDAAKAFFSEMSAKYADKNNVIYEICNEPNGSTTWSDIKSYAKTIIDTIRANDKDAVILVGTPNWSQYVDQAAADPLTGYSNVMYTLHFYAATHTDYLRDTMTAALDKGLPIFVSEYGICDASGGGAIDEAQANKWVETLDKYGVSYVAWSLCNKAETASFIRSDCSKTFGFTENDLSASGKWVYNMLRNRNSLPAAPLPSEPQTTESEAPPTESTEPTFDGEKKPVNTGTKITYSAELQNSWQSGEQYFYQYALTIKNNSMTDCGSWEVTLPFSGEISFSNGWNGNYSTDGKLLHISSVDYNGAVAAGGSVDNIGFIISGEKNLKLAG